MIYLTFLNDKEIFNSDIPSICKGVCLSIIIIFQVVDTSLLLAANVLRLGLSFLLVQVIHLSVNTQKITPVGCYRLPPAHSLRYCFGVRILFVVVELFIRGSPKGGKQPSKNFFKRTVSSPKNSTV